MSYKASRGGHAPGHLREWFLRYIENGLTIDSELRDEIAESIQHHRLRLRGKSLEDWLLGQLWSCTDQLPRTFATDVDDLAGASGHYSTYGQAARALRKKKHAAV